jgi:hypothetical protein
MTNTLFIARLAYELGILTMYDEVQCFMQDSKLCGPELGAVEDAVLLHMACLMGVNTLRALVIKKLEEMPL